MNFGLYARILVDIDLSKKPHTSLMVERDSGEVLFVETIYEKLPDF